MRGTFLVARRELMGYVNSSWGYGVVAAILVIDGYAQGLVAHQSMYFLFSCSIRKESSVR